ncbi:MAG: hypothetical protein IKQ71_07500 [Lachnospiraceae bacterium]|nr:hypothetical protein [Lachnospiraceae bacterium]
MRVLAVEDEVILLGQLTNRIREALPESEIVSFDNADDALDALAILKSLMTVSLLIPLQNAPKSGSW